MIRPDYADQFECIAGACEDSCCVGWSVGIDKDTYLKWQRLPPGPLRHLIGANVELLPRKPGGSQPADFACIKIPESKKCPMHNEQNLCQIQLEMGESYLSHLCSRFPRGTLTIDKVQETTLTLSCPEAARIVLTNPRTLGNRDMHCDIMQWNDGPGADTNPIGYFWPIREFTVTLLQNRNYPLWQRLFLLGSFCRRLESVFESGAQGDFPGLLSGFTQAIAKGTLRESIDSMSANNALQLDLVLNLAKQQAGAGSSSTRLAEYWKTFMAGIGHETLSFDMQCDAYAAAYKDFYEPFFVEHPFTLENLLLNMIFRSMFPYGLGILGGQSAIKPATQYALLVTEFALIKGLLIGIAGSRKQAFGFDDVVQAVQLVVKYFEHNQRFVSVCLEMLASKRLDSAYGLTMLLRN